MGKSIRCKVKKRNRSLKREHYEQQLGRERLAVTSGKLLTNPSYHIPSEIPKKNAFLYPNDPDAVFPQFQKQDMIDFRSNKIESSGYEFRGSCRKNKAEGLLNQVQSNSGLEIEMDRISEADANAEEEVVIEENEEDLLDDFGKMGIDGASKKIKKQKFMRMETEGTGPTKSKKKKQDGCKKSRRIMKW